LVTLFPGIFKTLSLMINKDQLSISSYAFFSG
jgi:hypothetical protein